MKYSSKTLEQVVESLSSLPSIGKKTALRLALHLIDDTTDKSNTIARALENLNSRIKHCAICQNISDAEICEICKAPHRLKNVICVVESIRDVMAIEDTGQYSGLYHVLGGVISPMDGIGPGDINIETLVDRVKKEEIDEIIMAISPTVEGDTTIYFISKLLSEFNVNISTIARGVSFGGELEYADEFTLGRSIASRTPYAKQELH